MTNEKNFTEGKIIGPLMKFALPVMSKWEPVTLFHIGLATPCSTVVQIILCFGCLSFLRQKKRL